MTLEILPVRGLAEVVPGDDLAALVAARADLRDGDVVVVSQKVVSKAEGRLVALAAGEDADAARRRVALAEAARVVVETPHVLVVATRHGFVCANAGVDASNVAPGHLVLLPVDPDDSARRLRAGLRRHAGADVAVVVSDTFGRPWRTGQTDVAIGVAGMAALRDERGRRDRDGNLLQVTEAAVADEVAAAADLVRGKADGIPVVVVRGLDWAPGDQGAQALVRPPSEDLFPRGRGALAAALATAPVTPTAAAEPAVLARALAAAERAGAGQVTVHVLQGAPTRVALTPDPPGAAGLVAAGLAAGVLVAAATDLGLAAAPRAPEDTEPGVIVVALGDE